MAVSNISLLQLPTAFLQLITIDESHTFQHAIQSTSVTMHITLVNMHFAGLCLYYQFYSFFVIVVIFICMGSLKFTFENTHCTDI